MFTYTTQGNGLFITIVAEDGFSCFLQGDDAVELTVMLGNCTNEQQVQAVLSEYDEACYFTD